MRPTPSQTVGPYFAIGMPWEAGPVADAGGVRVEGRVLDGNGDPLPDALIETWDRHAGAFARCATDDDGHWAVVVPDAPYIDVHVFARGLLRHLTTRICIAEGTVPDGVPEDRRVTLLASRTDDGYRFDIRLQGPGETAFFDV
jgi:protocatechuate 3,4-dioxygenase, alpha subunit